MRSNPISRREKRWLVGMLVLCALPVGFVWIYQRQNGAPQYKFLPRIIPSQNSENVFLTAWASYRPLKGIGKLGVNAVDPAIQSTLPTDDSEAYSVQYNRNYPLAAKIAFLRTNATTLNLVRTGLTQPYAYTIPGLPQSDDYWQQFRNLARLLLVEAHARGQRGDFSGAVDSLLTAYHLAAILPREAPLTAVSSSGQIRHYVQFDFWHLAPHLQADDARRAARAIERWHTQIPSLAQSLEWEKRGRLELLQHLIQQNDLRPLYLGLPWACADLQANVCGIAPAKMQTDMHALPPQLQLQLAWRNKKRLVENTTRNMDWNIAVAKKPFSQQNMLLPEENSYFDDPLGDMEHGTYRRTFQIYTRDQTYDLLLSTSLALTAFRLEHGHNPASLKELVPRYLSQVPLDPFSDGQPLVYKNQVLKYETGTQLIDKNGHPPSAKQLAAMGPDLRFNSTPFKEVPIYSTVPFTLYSVGHNARNDGGIPYQDKSELYDFKRRYIVNFSPSALLNTDVVAGVNGVY